MGFLDKLRDALGTGRSPRASERGGGGGTSAFGSDDRYRWIYAQCRRCGEPLRGRIDLHNEPSEEDDGTWVVRKGLMGSGKNLCFQTVEVMIHFDAKKEKVLDGEATGGKLLSAEEYHALLASVEAEAAAQAAPAAGAAAGTDVPGPEEIA